MRAVVLLVVGGVALAAPPSLLWEGKLSLALPAGILSWEMVFSPSWEMWGWQWKPRLRFADGVWQELEVAGAGRLGEFKASHLLAFSPREGELRGATLTAPATGSAALQPQALPGRGAEGGLEPKPLLR
ncbi:MAG: hypothetical protein ABDI20_01825 [Candidatus Bipolaricaulaceae bacterium]